MDNTDEKIQTALLDLMREKKLSDITIIDISDRSKIKRMKIYDKYAILQKIENGIIADLGKNNDILHLLETVNDERDQISLLIGKNGDHRFYEWFINFLTNRGLGIAEINARFKMLDTRQQELLVQYISSAVKELIQYWLNHSEMSVLELNSFFENLFKNGIDSFVEK